MPRLPLWIPTGMEPRVVPQVAVRLSMALFNRLFVLHLASLHACGPSHHVSASRGWGSDELAVPVAGMLRRVSPLDAGALQPFVAGRSARLDVRVKARDCECGLRRRRAADLAQPCVSRAEERRCGVEGAREWCSGISSSVMPLHVLLLRMVPPTRAFCCHGCAHSSLLADAVRRAKVG
jgi:hypothetical protein